MRDIIVQYFLVERRIKLESLFDLMKRNLGKDYKNVAEFNQDINNVDMKIVAETLYQYMYYQEAVSNLNVDNFKTYIEILKAAKENK